ncbi:MAG TPA: hypothetical protein VE988_22185, partial [Gemmataceae bacterium]|nr:hypothetical protein [Gemmataceae bacterium]
IELPAASFTALLFLILLWQAPRQTLLLFLPMCLLPYAAELSLNYVAIGEWEFAYSKFGGPWYEYAGSPWVKPAPGEMKYTVDFAYLQESRAMYIFHVLLGHHGLFSLAPIWVLAFVGMIMTAIGYRQSAAGSPLPEIREPMAESRQPLALLTLAVSVIVIGFYLVKTNNYGGGTSGMRWFMWMTPLWLLTMAPVVDWLAQRRWGRWLALACLAVSIFSANYPTWNPWRHPWLYDLLDSGGYIPY